MADAIIRNFNRPFPQDQIRVPRPPERRDTARRLPHDEDPAASHRTNVVRVQTLAGQPVDLVPDPGSTSTIAPGELVPGFHRAVAVPGVHSFGRLTTPDDDRATLAGLRQLLDIQGWHWTAQVTSSVTRQWVEPGALLLDPGDEELLVLCHNQGQDTVQLWDHRGLTTLDTRNHALTPQHAPIPLGSRPAATGCPLRLGADGYCKREGGPWTSGSISAALFWERHRRLLLDAFGCDVCHAGPVEQGAAVGLTDLFTPSRDGGWQRGPNRALPSEA